MGEMALLDDQRRRADVTTLGYWHLPVLGTDDFKSLRAVDPTIRRAATDRMKMDLEETQGRLYPPVGHGSWQNAGRTWLSSPSLARAAPGAADLAIFPHPPILEPAA